MLELPPKGPAGDRPPKPWWPKETWWRRRSRQPQETAAQEAHPLNKRLKRLSALFAVPAFGLWIGNAALVSSFAGRRPATPDPLQGFVRQIQNHGTMYITAAEDRLQSRMFWAAIALAAVVAGIEWYRRKRFPPNYW